MRNLSSFPPRTRSTAFNHCNEGEKVILIYHNASETKRVFFSLATRTCLLYKRTSNYIIHAPSFPPFHHRLDLLVVFRPSNRYKILCQIFSVLEEAQ